VGSSGLESEQKELPRQIAAADLEHRQQSCRDGSGRIPLGLLVFNCPKSVKKIIERIIVLEFTKL
jgi:hypothetical protein